MRRALLLILVFISLAVINRASGQIYLDENFNYTPGDSLGAHGWVSFSGGNTNVLTVATEGLMYPGYPLSGIGFSTRLRNTGQDAYKQFINNDTTGNIYVSFMVIVDSAGTGDYFFALLPDNSTTNYTGRVYVKDTLGGIKFGLSKSTNPIVYASNSVFYGTSYLLVLKYSFINGTQNDEVFLHVITGSIPGTEPPPTIGPVTQAIGDAPNIRRVALRQGTVGSAPVIIVDGIRVSRVWNNVLAVWPVSTVAENFSLSQNYPNPFNPSSKINFTIPEKGFVKLKVYDLLGKQVKDLVNASYPRGEYAVNFNAGDLSSGVYVYSIEVNTESGNTFKETKRMALVK
jgi:hypothetical protein